MDSDSDFTKLKLIKDKMPKLLQPANYDITKSAE